MDHSEAQSIVDKVTAFLQKILGPDEPAIVAGLIGAAGIAVVFWLTGAFDDGVSAQELAAILAPLGISLPIRQAVTPAAKKRRHAK